MFKTDLIYDFGEPTRPPSVYGKDSTAEPSLPGGAPQKYKLYILKTGFYFLQSFHKLTIPVAGQLVLLAP